MVNSVERKRDYRQTAWGSVSSVGICQLHSHDTSTKPSTVPTMNSQCNQTTPPTDGSATGESLPRYSRHSFSLSAGGMKGTGESTRLRLFAAVNYRPMTARCVEYEYYSHGDSAVSPVTV